MKKFPEVFKSIFIYLFGGIIFFAGGIFILILSVFPRGAVFERSLKLLSKSILFIAGIRVRVEGIEDIDISKQYIVMMNHVNIFDAFLFYSSFPGFARGVEEESHFRWPFYGWVMKRIGMIPINRKRGREALESLKRAAKLITEKPLYSVAVLPEGTRTRTGKLGNFKKGGFLLALESKVDILPVVQSGSYSIKKKGEWLIRPGKVILKYCPPVKIREYERNSIDELIKKVRSKFEKILSEK